MEDFKIVEVDWTEEGRKAFEEALKDIKEIQWVEHVEPDEPVFVEKA